MIRFRLQPLTNPSRQFLQRFHRHIHRFRINISRKSSVFAHRFPPPRTTPYNPPIINTPCPIIQPFCPLTKHGIKLLQGHLLNLSQGSNPLFFQSIPRNTPNTINGGHIKRSKKRRDSLRILWNQSNTHWLILFGRDFCHSHIRSNPNGCRESCLLFNCVLYFLR